VRTARTGKPRVTAPRECLLQNHRTSARERAELLADDFDVRRVLQVEEQAVIADSEVDIARQRPLRSPGGERGGEGLG
jgi:hypothetical protein